MLAVADLKLDLVAIRRLRKALGMTMEEAAEAAGFTSGRQYWYMIESGRQKDLPLSTINQISRVLKCNSKDILK